MKYQRITERRETPLTMSMWPGDSYSLKVCNRLAELEDKIESGELVDRNEYFYRLSIKHDVKICNEVVEECLQVLRDTRIAYPRDDYSWGWNDGIATAINRLTETYSIDTED